MALFCAYHDRNTEQNYGRIIPFCISDFVTGELLYYAGGSASAEISARAIKKISNTQVNISACNGYTRWSNGTFSLWQDQALYCHPYKIFGLKLK